jgi:hypothetical protein
MIEGQVGGHRLEPTTGRRAGAELLEVLVGSQEDLLRYVLRLPIIAGQAGRGRENHILIRTHKGRELGGAVGPGGWMLHWSVFV